MYIRGRVCVKGCATMRPETYLYIFPCTFRLFLLPLQYKRKQQPKHTSPLIYNIMIIKHLQGGLPTSASSVNAMCGASRHSFNPFRNDCLPFFLRYAEGVKGVGSIMDSDLQRSRRRATIVSKANISKWVIWVSYAFLLIDIEV